MIRDDADDIEQRAAREPLVGDRIRDDAGRVFRIGHGGGHIGVGVQPEDGGPTIYIKWQDIGDDGKSRYAFVDPDDAERPTAREIEAQRREVHEIEESLAELTAEIGVAALRRDVRLGRLQAMADAAERDLGFAKRALAELLERTEQ